jgi:predicted RNA-binding Zn ribbon-like protein
VDSEYTTKTGWLCLDFANTVDWHASDHPEESLNSYADLVGWAEKVGIVTADGAEKFTRRSAKTPAEAEATLAKAIKLREAIYGVLAARAHGQEIPADDLGAVNRAAADLHARSRLVVKDDGFAWEIDAGEDELDSLLWPVVRSALDLLTSADIVRLGQCADADGCGWLFWDTSRNRSRRWCDMGDCGNRAKVRRYYSRKKQQA